MRPLPHILITALASTSLFAQEASNEQDTPADVPDPIEELEPLKQPEPSKETDSDTDLDADEDPDSVVVRTEIPKQINLASGSKEFKILSPWAPKPLQAAPIGWQYIAATPEQGYRKSVLLKSGKKLSLKITPYILVPETSPLTVQVLEPGYVPEDGYKQKNSITSTLASSNQMLKEASDSLVQSISDLEELLLSLPKPEATKQPTP